MLVGCFGLWSDWYYWLRNNQSDWSTGEGAERWRRVPQQRRGGDRASLHLLADRQGQHPLRHQGKQAWLGHFLLFRATQSGAFAQQAHRIRMYGVYATPYVCMYVCMMLEVLAVPVRRIRCRVRQQQK